MTLDQILKNAIYKQFILKNDFLKEDLRSMLLFNNEFV